MNSPIYVGNTMTYPSLREWFERKESSDQRLEEATKFIRAQAKALDEERVSVWKDLFEILKEEGLIPKDDLYDDYAFSINKEHEQVFMKKPGPDEKVMPFGIQEFLKKILPFPID